MSLKTAVTIGFFVGSLIGGYIPTLFGASMFSFSSLFGNFLGGIAGIYLGYKLVNG